MRAVLTTAWLGVMLMPMAARAVTPDDFQARTTRQLVALCAAKPSDPAYVQAIQFCYGFAVGALSYDRAVTAPGTAPKLCNLPASRAEALSRFVDWAQAHPQYNQDNPANTLFRFLDATYACKQ